jgi:hypothetical protein
LRVQTTIDWISARTAGPQQEEQRIVQVFLKTLSGKHIMLEVEPTDRIEDFRAQVAEHEEISVQQVVLIFAGKRLEDGNTVQDYSIQKDSTLHLVVLPPVDDGDGEAEGDDDTGSGEEEGETGSGDGDPEDEGGETGEDDPEDSQGGDGDTDDDASNSTNPGDGLGDGAAGGNEDQADDDAAPGADDSDGAGDCGQADSGAGGSGIGTDTGMIAPGDQTGRPGVPGELDPPPTGDQGAGLENQPEPPAAAADTGLPATAAPGPAPGDGPGQGGATPEEGTTSAGSRDTAAAVGDDAGQPAKAPVPADSGNLATTVTPVASPATEGAGRAVPDTAGGPARFAAPADQSVSGPLLAAPPDAAGGSQTGHIVQAEPPLTGHAAVDVGAASTLGVSISLILAAAAVWLRHRRASGV